MVFIIPGNSVFVTLSEITGCKNSYILFLKGDNGWYNKKNKQKTHFPGEKLDVKYFLKSASLFVGMIICSTILINTTNIKIAVGSKWF